MLHRPQKKRLFFCRFFERIHNWKHRYRCIFLVPVSYVFCNSARTPAPPSIQMCTTLRWTLWCCHYSMAKRQQFSCPLRTATLSLKFDNVVPQGWIYFFSSYLSCNFALYGQVRVRVVFLFCFSDSCSKKQACDTIR